MNELKKCIEFLKKNEWESHITISHDEKMIHFFKDNSIGVDLTEDNMVFIGENGDFLHLPTDRYTLIGVLIEHRQLPINYKS